MASSHVDVTTSADKPQAHGAISSGRELEIWRISAICGVTVAAALLAYLLLGPAAIAPATEPASAGRYVAAIDSSGREPALIVELTPESGTFRIRDISAQTPLGRSLQLWHVGEDGTAESIAVLDPDRPYQIVEGAAHRTAAGSRVEVTVEATGGSASGAPTGPVIYSGTLSALD